MTSSPDLLKKITNLILGLLFFSGFGLAQSPDTADTIRAIRQRCLAINSRLTKYKQVKKPLDGYSTEGGELIAYFEGDQIVKLAANFYGESGRAVEEYYYQDGQLIFVFRKESHYSKPLTGKVVKVEEQRFYFNNGTLIRWINEKGKRVASGAEFAKKHEEYVSSSKEFASVALSPNE